MKVSLIGGIPRVFIEIILFLGIVITSTILLLNYTNLNNIFITMSAFAIALSEQSALNSLFANYVGIKEYHF